MALNLGSHLADGCVSVHKQGGGQKKLDSDFNLRGNINDGFTLQLYKLKYH